MDLISSALFSPLATLAQATPPITAGYLIQLISRILHILSSIILVGGLFYIRSVLYPAGIQACYSDRRATWAKWVGVASLFLLVTGIYNFIVINQQAKAGGEGLPPVYHMIFGIKFLLGVFVMFIAAILAGKTEAAERFRGQMGKWLSVAWMSSLAVVVLAAILRSLHWTN